MCAQKISVLGNIKTGNTKASSDKLAPSHVVTAQVDGRGDMMAVALAVVGCAEANAETQPANNV